MDNVSIKKDEFIRNKFFIIRTILEIFYNYTVQAMINSAFFILELVGSSTT